MNAQRYPSDLTDEQYAAIEALLPCRGGEGKVGRPPRYTNRQLLNGIFYALRTGCAWRYLPHDLPHWTSVYACWKRWSLDGTMDRIHDALRRLSYQTHARDEGGGRGGRARGGAAAAGSGGAAAAPGLGADASLSGIKGGRTGGKGRASRAAADAADAAGAAPEGEAPNPEDSGITSPDTNAAARAGSGKRRRAAPRAPEA